MAYSCPNSYHYPPRQDDVVYFSGDTSPWSWAGVIGDENDMTDDQVNDYINTTNPQLFDKLRGMRFGSSDIPLTLKPLRGLRRFDSIKRERCSQTFAKPLSLPLHNKTTNLRTLTSAAPSPPDSDIHYSQPIQTEIGQQASQIADRDQLKLDGIAQQDILAAAEKLYPNIKPPKTVSASFHDKNVEPECAYTHPTNSRRAHDLRAQKQLEIGQTLAEVSKYEKASSKAAILRASRRNARDTSPDASVLITRPSYHVPLQDRYKKQGLTQHDRRKQRQDATNAPSPPTPRQNDGKETRLVVRYCYCREPEDGHEMIRCSKEWCPVGWFHLKCTGLDRLPFLNEEFYCCYCADGVDHQISHTLFSGYPDNASTTANELVDSLKQRCLANDIETDVTYEEPASAQRRTLAPGRFSNYQEEYEEDDGTDITDDEDWAAGDYERLRQKIVKWRAVNEPYQESNAHGYAPTPGDDQMTVQSSTTSFFNDDSDDSSGGQEEDEEQDDYISDTSTIRASSLAAAMTIPEDKRHREHSYEHSQEDDSDSELTELDSAEDDEVGDEINQSGLLSLVRIHSIKARHPSTIPETFSPPQPVTPQRSTRTSSSYPNICKRSPYSDSSTPSDEAEYDRPYCGLRTPSVEIHVSPGKSSQPWGTPVNVNIKRQFQLLEEPPSPSPAGKRKHSEVDNDEWEVQDEGDAEDEGIDEQQDGDVYDQEDKQDGDVVPFMLDTRTLRRSTA